MSSVDSIRISPEILGIIARIDEFKGAWRAMGARSWTSCHPDTTLD
jgi:hypothetical protein